MIIKSIIRTTCACLAVVSFNTSAALIERLGGLAYYDDVADLTWLADANYAQTSGYDADGRMNWVDANTWAAGLTVGGVSGWRLADTLQPDASCESSGSISSGHNCTGSEMGDLFYNALGNAAGSLTSTGPFSNVQSYRYWSATEFAPSTLYAWTFDMSNGYQNAHGKQLGNFYGWAVQLGDVSAVPVPAAVWLFGSGLLGLIGVARRKKT